MKASNSALIESLAQSIEKKDNLSRNSYTKYAVRAMLATMFLTLGTGIAFYISMYADSIVPHSGKFFYAFIINHTIWCITTM